LKIAVTGKRKKYKDYLFCSHTHEERKNETTFIKIEKLARKLTEERDTCKWRKQMFFVAFACVSQKKTNIVEWLSSFRSHKIWNTFFRKKIVRSLEPALRLSSAREWSYLE
jgi:hypothetical protein